MDYPKPECLESRLYSEFEKRVLQRFGSGNAREAKTLIQKIYLEEQDGCIPDEFIGEELLYAIRSKFFEFFSVMTDTLEKDMLESECAAGRRIVIWIDPSYDDETSVVIGFQAALLLRYARKAWNFSWPDAGALKKEMAELYREMRDQLNVYFWEGLRYVPVKN